LFISFFLPLLKPLVLMSLNLIVICTFVTLECGPAAVIDNRAVEREATYRHALQKAAKQEAANLRVEQFNFAQQHTGQRTRRLADEEQQTELPHVRQNFTVSHSTYSPDQLRYFDSGFSNVGLYREMYTAINSGRTHSTGNPPFQSCFNCGEMHWRKDCPYSLR
jgi:hypothetical protein